MNLYNFSCGYGRGLAICVFEGGVHIKSSLIQEDDLSNTNLVNALNGLESLVLALACADLIPDVNRFEEALQTAIDAIENNYGDD